jgi:hypothetical protein
LREVALGDLRHDACAWQSWAIQSGKRVSFGLVRMANIDPLFEVSLASYQYGAPVGVPICLSVYGWRFQRQSSSCDQRIDRLHHDIPALRVHHA